MGHAVGRGIAEPTDSWMCLIPGGISIKDLGASWWACSCALCAFAWAVLFSAWPTSGVRDVGFLPREIKKFPWWTAGPQVCRNVLPDLVHRSLTS